METNDIITGTIEKVIYGGNGLIRQDNFVIFVPGTLPGEKVRVKITQLKKSYAIAELSEVLEPSTDRTEPNCRTTGSRGDVVRIPGCVYDHMSYDTEVAIKQEQLLEFVKYMSGVVAENSTFKNDADPLPSAPQPECPISNYDPTLILPPFKSPKELSYRNKLILHVHNKSGSVRLGYQE